MYVIACSDGHHTGMAGAYRDDPDMAAMIASAGMSKLYTYQARKRMGEFNASALFQEEG